MPNPNQQNPNAPQRDDSALRDSIPAEERTWPKRPSPAAEVCPTPSCGHERRFFNMTNTGRCEYRPSGNLSGIMCGHRCVFPPTPEQKPETIENVCSHCGGTFAYSYVCTICPTCFLAGHRFGVCGEHCKVTDASRAQAEVVTRSLLAPAAPAPDLHWPFAAKHDNCTECDREYEPPPATEPASEPGATTSVTAADLDRIDAYATQPEWTIAQVRMAHADFPRVVRELKELKQQVDYLQRDIEAAMEEPRSVRHYD